MFSVLRSRMSYANVVATLAMVFALTGGAYAASKYLITSTKQIKPSVLASLKGKAGAQGPAGPAGVAGAPGAKGANGADGKEGTVGKEGAKGATGPAGATGPKGATGATGATGLSGFTSTLPEGKTETGTWAFSEFDLPPSAGNSAFVPISFPIPLKEASKEPGEHAFYYTKFQTEQIEEEELKPASGCKGSLHAPTAPAGELCIYTETEETHETAKFRDIAPPRGAGPATQFGSTGAIVYFNTTAEPSVLVAKGTWAVTAPTTP